MPSICVGTYAKYNSGTCKGDWLVLEDYACKQDFYEACAELHDDEADPEFIFLGWEDIPSIFITECSIDEEFWNYMDCSLDEDVKEAYVDAMGVWNEEDCKHSYIGEFRSDTELAEHVVDEMGFPSEMSGQLRYYFDYEAYGRDMRLGGDVMECNGYYFWRQ